MITPHLSALSEEWVAGLRGVRPNFLNSMSSVVISEITGQGHESKQPRKFMSTRNSLSHREIALQQADFYAGTFRTLGHRSVAHPNHVDAVGRDLIIQDQVT